MGAPEVWTVTLAAAASGQARPGWRPAWALAASVSAGPCRSAITLMGLAPGGQWPGVGPSLALGPCGPSAGDCYSVSGGAGQVTEVRSGQVYYSAEV